MRKKIVAVLFCLSFVSLFILAGCGGGGGGGATTSPAVCGNGQTETGETCDDGNKTSGDGCSSVCLTENAAAVCGNSSVESGEDCDAGANNTDTACTAAYNSTCQYCSKSCRQITVTGGSCGDNVVNGSEGCDQGTANTETACSPSYGSTCQYCDTSCVSQTVNGASCGDGTVNGGEQCDQGAGNTNTSCTPGATACTYCDLSCQSHTVNPPTPSCGDGNLDAGEECDQGGSNTNTPCTAAYGGTCNYCNTSCQQLTVTGAYCGDGTINGAEGCDNGTGNTNTACSPSYGSSCSYCDTSCASHTVIGAYCGDGIVNGSEACDDGGTANGDGCSATCQLEAPAYVSQQYVSQCSMPNGGYISGMFVSGDRKYLPDANNDVVVVMGLNDCNTITTISVPGLSPVNGCASPDGTKIIITHGDFGQFSLFTFNGSAYTHVNEFGSDGTGFGQFDVVEQCVFDSSGAIVFLVDDTMNPTNLINHRVWKWNSSTQTFVTSWGSKGSTAGLFNRPWGVTRDSSNNIFIMDLSGRIQKFDVNGNVDANFSAGSNLTSPTYIDIDSNDRLYAMDFGGGKVKVFSNITGELLGTVNNGGPVGGNFTQGIGVALDSLDSVYITDQATNKVFKYALP